MYLEKVKVNLKLNLFQNIVIFQMEYKFDLRNIRNHFLNTLLLILICFINLK